MKDMVGRDFAVGDYICFPTRSGSSIHQKIAKVIDISFGRVFIRSIRWGWPNPYCYLGKKARLVALKRAIILNDFKMPEKVIEVFENGRSK